MRSRLEQIVTESNTWVRRCGAVWFDPTEPIVEEAIGAVSDKDIVAMYEEAINAANRIATYAEEASNILKKAKVKRAARG